MPHPRAKDITGLTVGYLTATRYLKGDGKKSIWVAQCVCGNEINIAATELTKQARRGITSSCGCKKMETIGAKNRTHGMTQHPAHGAWHSMWQRCANPNHRAWMNYGGRGITVSAEWRTFEQFWADMGPTYREGLTLDRIDNNTGYSASNCRWATRKEQAQNTRKTRMVETVLGRMVLGDLSRLTGVPRSTLDYRLRRGQPLWPESMTFSTAAHDIGSSSKEATGSR